MIFKFRLRIYYVFCLNLVNYKCWIETAFKRECGWEFGAQYITKIRTF